MLAEDQMCARVWHKKAVLKQYLIDIAFTPFKWRGNTQYFDENKKAPKVDH